MTSIDGGFLDVITFTDALRTELMHDGADVDLVMVQMPALNTPHFLTGRATG